MKQGDTKALAQHLSRLMDDPRRRQSLRRVAQAQAKAYDWSAVTRRLLEALQLTEAKTDGDRR